MLNRFVALLLQELELKEQLNIAQERLEEFEDAMSTSKGSNRVALLLKETEVLRKQAADAEVALKQAKNQQAEYLRLADRFNALERENENRHNETDKDK